jgi:DNA repair exonuclease SbcCD ATPase subunit
MAEHSQQAKKEGLPENENLFKKLEEGTKESASTPSDREKALGKVNDLVRQLQDRRRQLGGADKVKEQLDQLKNIDRGPADKFAQAVAKGDLKQAVDELKKLQDQLENSKLTDQQKADLAKQLEQMKDKLNKLAESHKAAQADLQKRADQMRKVGQTADADKLEQQLRQLQNQGPQMQQLQNLANKLGQCTQCLKQGNAKDAAKALDEMKDCMGSLQQQMDEMQMLDDAMQQLAQAKDQMVCPFCNGAGCEKCNGIPASGLGKGKGIGERPEAKTKTSTYDSHVKQKVGQGTARVVDLVDGPNIKGDVESRIQDEFDSTRRGSTDPSSGRQIPKKLSQHAREYFDNLREGE